ncbi:Uncharacterized protein FKW44_011178 [Caligus rogercresseyi]|uniref:Ig-like domain-containing protein n=1 Tax=Caligus rogercresseyi TaxID=217165 RepID=A0A7T8KA38_CALRO|nr:Uncharacterized protein FKW44_011178 [Caligus rogercresseyi]
MSPRSTFLIATSVLSCRVHAEPDPDVKWMKNSQELMDSGGRYKVSFDGKREYSLSISNVGIEDFASYACSAINSLGKDQRIVRLSGEHTWDWKYILEDLMEYLQLCGAISVSNHVSIPSREYFVHACSVNI